MYLIHPRKRTCGFHMTLATAGNKMKLPNQSAMKAYSIELKDVRLLDSPFKENMERESRWILSIDVDRLLHNSIYRTDKNQSIFKTTDRKINLEPLCRIHRERYMVYWNLNN